MSTFYVFAKDRDKAQWVTERFGPNIWYARRDNARSSAGPGEKIFKVTVTVEEDS